MEDGRTTKEEVDGEHYFIDGFDRSVQRPKCSEEQEETFSGKHGKNTVKHTCISDENSEIMYLGNMRMGSVHDKRMADEEELNLPNESFLWKDLGYVGFLPKNVHSFEPHKKPRGGELTKLQKAENQAIAAVRIVVEHAIGGLKRCRIVKEITRIYNYEIRDRVGETSAALHNFRLRSRNGYKRNALFNPV